MHFGNAERLVAGLHVFVAALFCGVCRGGVAEGGPFWGAGEVSCRADGSRIRLTKFWVLETDRASRTVNYVAPMELVAPASGASEGRVRFGLARKLLTDPHGIYSSIVPVAGSDLVVEIQTQDREQTTATIVGAKPESQRQLASFPVRCRDPNDGACAVTPSGRYVLLVNESRITVWDVVAWRELDRNVGPLCELVKVMIDKYGNPGRWWLTDDLRYIIAAPSWAAWTEDGEGGESNIELALTGMKFNLSTDGVVFDRQTHALAKFPKSLQSVRASEIADVRSVNGDLQFLYSADDVDLTVAIADGSGKARAKRVLRTLRYKEVVGWKPESDEVYFQVREADTWLPGDEPKSNRHLVVWDIARDQEHRYLIRTEEIRRAVEGGPDKGQKGN